LIFSAQTDDVLFTPEIISIVPVAMEIVILSFYKKRLLFLHGDFVHENMFKSFFL
jgi:hypothetical protein